MKSNESIQVTARFFDVINTLVVNKVIRGRQTFCNMYRIDKRNFYTQQKDYSREYIKIDWLIYIISDFGVNANWLLTGEGKPFNKKYAANGKSIEGLEIVAFKIS